MAYFMTGSITISYVGDGTGPMGVPGSPSLKFSTTTYTVVPGANAPTSGNISTGAAAVSTLLAAQMNVAAQLAVIQAWATGGPLGNPGANG